MHLPYPAHLDSSQESPVALQELWCSCAQPAQSLEGSDMSKDYEKILKQHKLT